MTCTADDDVGTRYVIEGGEEILIDDVGSPVGTTIVVRDLFYNIPARLKFLKKDVQEGNYIASLLERIALSNPDVSFKFIRDGKSVFQTPGDGDLKSAIYSVFGKEFTSQLLPVEGESNGIKVRGFVTKPTAGRGSRSMQTFFVNKRYVKSVVFLSSLEAAYKNSIMVGKYPACVLFVEMPFETVDVNVHPAKTEVRFYDDKRVFDAVYYSVLSALNADVSRPQASFNTAKIFQQQPEKGEQIKLTEIDNKANPVPEKKTEKAFIIKEFGKPVTGEENIVKSPEKEEKTLDFLKDEYYKPKVSIINTPKIDVVTEKVTVPVVDAPVSCDSSKVIEKEERIVEEKVPEKTVAEPTKVITPEYKYIGEAFNTYLIAEVENKMILIDKHAAHERMLFEKFRKQGVGESQMMLLPVTVTLSPDEYAAVTENIELLANAGYEIDDFGDRTVKLSACPPQLVEENLVEIITEIAGYLANNIRTVMPEKLDWIYHSMACRAAIKAGNFTSRYEAEKFVGTVLSNPDIRYCPHGRPVLIEMTRYELEKQFKRIN